MALIEDANMSDFAIAYAFLATKEGTLSDNSKDLGGFTYKGISRKYHPDWEGWKFIDAGDFESANPLVFTFYKSEYWDKYGINFVYNQPIANRLFEQIVNGGEHTPISNLQNILNAISPLDALNVDGKIGNNTINKLNKLSNNASYAKAIEFALRCTYVNFLIGRAIEDNSQSVFTVGWINREMT